MLIYRHDQKQSKKRKICIVSIVNISSVVACVYLSYFVQEFLNSKT